MNDVWIVIGEGSGEDSVYAFADRAQAERFAHKTRSVMVHSVVFAGADADAVISMATEHR